MREVGWAGVELSRGQRGPELGLAMRCLGSSAARFAGVAKGRGEGEVGLRQAGAVPETPARPARKPRDEQVRDAVSRTIDSKPARDASYDEARRRPSEPSKCCPVLHPRPLSGVDRPLLPPAFSEGVSPASASGGVWHPCEHRWGSLPPDRSSCARCICRYPNTRWWRRFLGRGARPRGTD